MRRKLVYTGWGSLQLLQFLKSIGEETAKRPPQQKVVEIILKYCADHSLFDEENSRRIVCDAKLHNIFRRKWISKYGLPTLVKKHFDENGPDDDGGFSMTVEQWVDRFEVGEGSGENNPVSGEKRKRKRKRKRDSGPEAGSGEKGKEIVVARKGLFASVTADNIKRVYLRRHVLEELMKEPENFDAKVVGCFVRIKAESYDPFRRTSHLLVLVAGVKRSPGNTEIGDSVLLEVPCVLKDVPISQISDDNFTEDECEELRQRVKDGLLKRPLLADLQEKAQSLHEVITKDWIVRELSLLQRRIDQASVKGWRRERAKYLKTWITLKTPEEQSRLLQEIPEIIADKEAGEAAPNEMPRNEEQVAILQPKEVSIPAATGNVTQAVVIYHPPAPTASLSPATNNARKIGEVVIQNKAAKTTEKGTPAAVPFAMVNSRERDATNMATKTVERTGKEASQKTGKSTTKMIEIIDLSDDDDNGGNNTRPAAPSNQAAAATLAATSNQAAAAGTARVVPTENVNAKTWRCMTVRQGLRLAGLYPISLLKRWVDNSPNPSALHFKVWKVEQREEQAIPLEEAIRLAYHLA